MKRVFWFALTVALLLAFSFSAQAEALHVWDSVGVNPNRLSRLDGIKCFGIPHPERITEVITATFPDTVWIHKGELFAAVTFGNGKIQENVIIGFDSTRALMWTGSDFELFEVLGCTNLAIRARFVPHFLPAPTQPAPTPAVVSTATEKTGVALPWQNWLAGLGILLLFGLIAGFLVWLFRRLANSPGGTPVVPPTTTTTAPIPPTPDDATDFEAHLDEHDENIRALNRLLDGEETRRQALIDNRLIELDKTAQATEAERQRLLNMSKQQ